LLDVILFYILRKNINLIIIRILLLLSKRGPNLIRKKYAADIKDNFGETPNMDLFETKVTIGFRAIYFIIWIASKVSGSDDKELQNGQK